MSLLNINPEKKLIIGDRYNVMVSIENSRMHDVMAQFAGTDPVAMYTHIRMICERSFVGYLIPALESYLHKVFSNTIEIQPSDDYLNVFYVVINSSCLYIITLVDKPS